MKKKSYQEPMMRVVKVQPVQMLAGSRLGQASVQDYEVVTDEGGEDWEW